MTLLGDFTSPDRLKELVEKLTDGGDIFNRISIYLNFSGKRNHRFENFAIQNISKWILAGLINHWVGFAILQLQVDFRKRQ